MGVEVKSGGEGVIVATADVMMVAVILRMANRKLSVS